MRVVLALSLLFLSTAPGLAAQPPRVDCVEIVVAGLFQVQGRRQGREPGQRIGERARRLRARNCCAAPPILPPASAPNSACASASSARPPQGCQGAGEDRHHLLGRGAAQSQGRQADAARRAERRSVDRSACSTNPIASITTGSWCRASGRSRIWYDGRKLAEQHIQHHQALTGIIATCRSLSPSKIKAFCPTA